MFTVKQYQDEAVTYVPDFMKNRELCEEWIAAGEEGPRPFFTVTLLPLSGADYNHLSGQSYRNFRKGMNFIEGAERTVKRIVKQYVTDVSGLAFQRQDGSVAKPTNGNELYHECSIGYPALGEMIDDIVDALKDISRANDGDLKKLRQRLGGSTRRQTMYRPPELGDVPDAMLTSNRTQQNQTKLNRESQETATGQDRT
jgi:hypothetical protein